LKVDCLIFFLFYIFLRRADIWFCCAFVSFCLTISGMFYDFNVVMSIHTSGNVGTGSRIGLGKF